MLHRVLELFEDPVELFGIDAGVPRSMIDLFERTLELANQAIEEVEAPMGCPGFGAAILVADCGSDASHRCNCVQKPTDDLNALADVFRETRTELTTG